MKTAELKSNLHRLIVETDDIEVLTKIYAFFEQLKNKDTDWWDLLSIYEQITINKGIEQLDNGKGIPYKEVKKKVNNLYLQNS